MRTPTAAQGQRLFAPLVFLTSFTLYLQTHCASIYLDDSGETVSVAALLGIGHPPGYPLHTLLTSLAARFPLGDVAIRINLFACALQALSVMLLFILTRRLARQAGWGASVWGATFAAALFAVGPVAWHNALVAKGSVYGLNNALTLGLLLTLTSELPEKLRARLFWTLLGLAFGHHYMSQLILLPAYGLLATGGRAGRLRTWLGSATFLIPGLSTYLYLVLRSYAGCELDWGQIRSIQDFFFFLFRQQYVGSELSQSALTMAAQAAYALRNSNVEGAWLTAPLAALALWALPGRRQALAFGLLALGPLLATTLYLDLKAERLPIMRPYLFPTYLALACLAGLGLAHLLQQARRWALGLALAANLAPLGIAASRYDSLNLSGYHQALDFAKSTLLHIPRNGALYVNGDGLVFPLWYLQRVKAYRSDVAVVGVAVLPMQWVRDDLARQHPRLTQPRVQGLIGTESTGALVRALVESNPEIPAFFTYDTLEPGAQGLVLRNEGMVWRALPAAPRYETLSPALLATRMSATQLRPSSNRESLDLLGRDMAVHHNLAGTLAEDMGQIDLALKQFTLAQSHAPLRADFAYNVGNALHRLGRLGEAQLAYQRSLALDPSYVSAWYNMGVNQYKRGDLPAAREAFAKVLQLEPGRTDVLLLLKQFGI